MFSGVNNHLSSILSAAAIISNEISDSFVWLFEEFKNCMKKDPKAIITDQDDAMNVAIEWVFPNTFHRLCKWHITYKMCNKIRSVYRNKKEIERFNTILNMSDTIENFKCDWDLWTKDNI